jgi:hypothetical protein
MQVTYRPYKRASSFYLSLLFDDAYIVIFDAFANKLLSTAHLKYFSAYIHIDVVVKSSQLSSMHEDVKFKFIIYLVLQPKSWI